MFTVSTMAYSLDMHLFHCTQQMKVLYTNNYTFSIFSLSFYFCTSSRYFEIEPSPRPFCNFIPILDKLCKVAVTGNVYKIQHCFEIFYKQLKHGVGSFFVHTIIMQLVFFVIGVNVVVRNQLKAQLHHCAICAICVFHALVT